MGGYPYITNLGKLREFLYNIPKINVPDKVSISYIEDLGYKSKNDRPIISVLKFIDFIDVDGKPTNNWMEFRNTERLRIVMGSCVRKAYSDLFKIFPDPWRKDVEALRNFFSTRVGGGEQVLNLTVSTFRMLCEIAEFSADFETPEISLPPLTKVSEEERKPVLSTTQGLVINLNIQLQLPETKDAEIYDKIFESLRKHLLK